MKLPLKNLATICISFLIITNSNGQTLKKNYFEFSNQVAEVFYVNEKGEKVGNYKSYFRSGLIEMEANYKNGVLDGLVKEYQALTSKSCLKRTAMYKNGDVNGLTTYYGGDNCDIKIAQGNCTTYYKRIGVWTFIEELPQNMPAGFKYLTYTQTLDGEDVIEDAKTVYYYPSKKIFSEYKGNIKVSYNPEGKIVGEETFDSNGKLSEEKFIHKNGTVAMHNKYYRSGEDGIEELNSWFENGKVQKSEKKVNRNTVSYVGYNEDGTKDQLMIHYEQNEKRIKEENERYISERKAKIEKFASKIKETEEQHNSKIIQHREALESLKAILSSAKNEYKSIGGGDTINLLPLKNVIDLAQTKISEIEKLIELKNTAENQEMELKKKNIQRDEKLKKLYYDIGIQGSSIDNKYKEFTDSYISYEAKLSTELITGRLIHAEIRPDNTKHLHEKADSHYKELEAEYNKKSPNTSEEAEKKIEDGKKLLEILDKLIKLAPTNPKELNKALKKAKTKEEETQLLGF